jgi:hypothetical protein
MNKKKFLNVIAVLWVLAMSLGVSSSVFASTYDEENNIIEAKLEEGSYDFSGDS